RGGATADSGGRGLRVDSRDETLVGVGEVGIPADTHAVQRELGWDPVMHKRARVVGAELRLVLVDARAEVAPHGRQRPPEFFRILALDDRLVPLYPGLRVLVLVAHADG